MGLKSTLEILWVYRKYIPIGLVISFSTGVIKLWREWGKHNKKIRLNHSKDLIKELQNKVNSDVVLYLEKNDFKLEVKPYPEELNEHLKNNDAYKDINKLIERRDFYINKLHNEESKVFYNNLRDNITNCIKQGNYIEFDNSRSSLGQKNFFNKETIELDLLNVIRNNYQASESIKFRIEPHGNLHYLYYNSNIWVAGDDEQKLIKIWDILKKVNCAIRGNRFRILVQYFEEIREDHNQIKKELNKIITDVEKKDIYLNGKCKNCPKEDNIPEYIWQCIKKF